MSKTEIKINRPKEGDILPFEVFNEHNLDIFYSSYGSLKVNHPSSGSLSTALVRSLAFMLDLPMEIPIVVKVAKKDE